MTYVLTIYVAFSFGVISVDKMMPNRDACKTEAAKIVLGHSLPSSVSVSAKCRSLGLEMRV